MTTTLEDISLEDFNSWRKDSITKAIFSYLEEYRDFLINQMKDLDVFLGEKEGERGRRVGLIEGINLLLNIEYEDAEDNIKEEVSKSV